MKTRHPLRRLLVSVVMVAATAAAPAIAQISLNINIAPPAPRYEVVPAMALGYIWVPGYWAWNVDQYVWIRGRTIVQREGYRWEPDRWERSSDDKYYRLQGRWEHDDSHNRVKTGKKHKSRHWKHDDDDDSSGHRNRGRDGRDDKGRDRRD